jgi:hypothetical protein
LEEWGYFIHFLVLYFNFFLIFFFLRQGLVIYSRLASNSWFSHLSLLSGGITGVHHHLGLYVANWVWWFMPVISAFGRLR